ncbi:MAG: carboxypeptidase regulatory-like domain-containing protein [Myxococcales bacterium]|mgnify:CR=1 FL=1|nr:carboxypeptidase regulatory-like domain-containing protein [Myxococcales bacterium]
MRGIAFAVGSIGAVLFAALAAPGCGGGDEGSTFGPGGGSGGGDGGGCVGFGCDPSNEGGRPGCEGLECQQVTCSGGAKTTLTGRVFDPAGKVPLYNVVVYVANRELEPIATGPTCDRCDGNVSGKPIALTSTDANGDFRLEDVPADTDFPLVMQIGKWRRKVTIPKVAACQSVAASPDLTRLPRNRTEGDIPRIALTTGSADPLECLLRKIGLDGSEFGTAGSEARVHLFTGGSTPPSTATSSFDGGGAFAQASSLWGSRAELEKYDIVMLSCEGGEHQAAKPEAARQALYDYAKTGGRVFTSHFHHYWFSNSPVPEVKAIASWTNDFTCQGAGCTFEAEPAKDVVVNATVNSSFAKGAAMKKWLKNTQSLTGPGETLPIQEARHNVNAVTANALSWMTIQNPAAGNKVAHEYVSFNTPVGAPDDQVCGRVVYSDLHVGAGDTTGAPFPNGCVTPDMTPQQKALEFMLFDLSSCIQKDDKPPVLPK